MSSSLSSSSTSDLDLDDFPTALDAKTCIRRNLCPVTGLRPQGPELFETHSLYFEQHGRGKRKIVFIMGLNSTSFSWMPQVRYFGASGFKEERESERARGVKRGDTALRDLPEEEDDVDKDGGYTILVFDNRGVGNSTCPTGPYTTSGMAEDVIVLLDYLGWTRDHELNIVGVSLGGMIAQELAYRIPHRILSLVLAVTTPGGYPWNNLPPIYGILSLAKLTFTSDVGQKVPTIMPMLYPVKWLQEKAEDDPRGRTNYQVEAEGFIHRVSITRKQQLMGHFSQMAAGLTHHVDPSRLRRISALVPKVTIVTGDEDHLVRVSNSFRLKEAMPEAELVQFRETGHGVQFQRKKEFNRLIERSIREGEERVEKGWTPEKGWSTITT
ncbi:hypothetical protein AX15_004088 [Amanita polypyramis BW_CC]|nr:hypothetical protein AX15_004088 [Amanita polypyramis BW_CC]